MSLVRFLAQQGGALPWPTTRANPPELATLQRDYPEVEVRCGELDVDFLPRASCVSPGLAPGRPALREAAARGVKVRGYRPVHPPRQGADRCHHRFQRQEHRDHPWSARWRRRPAGRSRSAAISVPRRWTCSATRSSCTLTGAVQLPAGDHRAPGAEVATCLNISEDHMDRYDGCRAQTWPSTASSAVPVGWWSIRDDALSRPLIADQVPCWTFRPGQAGLQTLRPDRREWRKASGLPVRAAAGRTEENRGAHKSANALAALALGMPSARCRSGHAADPAPPSSVPHRCQWVRERAGRGLLRRLKATNVGAALARHRRPGSDIAGKLVLIAGGDGKRAPTSPHKAPVSKFCRAVVLLRS